MADDARSSPIKLGVNCWNQYTDWSSFLAAQQRADRLGFDSMWTWDHLYPIVGSHVGPILEGHVAMTGVAAQTRRATVGLLVGANTFRNPALVAKMITTLDHVSGGRAVLGIGAAWFETEHRAYGIDYGSGPPERLRWLREALPIMRAMLHGEELTADGPRYRVHEIRNDPPPIQQRLPILVGGSGPKVTMRLVAQYADMNNFGGSPASLVEKERLLLEHCDAVGRDPSEIERTFGLGTVVIRDSREEAQRVQREIFERNGRARLWQDQPVGTPEDVAERLLDLADLGYRHLIAGFPPPYDEESMTRLATEVRSTVERRLASR